MTAIHPSELGYAFAYAQATDIIGWGIDPFRPPEGAAETWSAEAEARLAAAGRVTGSAATGLHFTDDMAQAVLALVNPALVLVGQRRASGGLRQMTVHVRGDDLIALTRDAGGLFDIARHADLAAATAACAAFAGATLAARDRSARLDSTAPALSDLGRRARQGDRAGVAGDLQGLGLAEGDAASAAGAMAAPAAAGMVGAVYCSDGRAAETEAWTVLTGADDATWVLFAPGSPEGPMVLERSSTAALAARVAVSVMARLTPA